MLNKLSLGVISLVLSLTACVQTQSAGTQSPREASLDTGEPCGDTSCEPAEHCEFQPVACPPNEVCVALVEEVCVPDPEPGDGDDGGDVPDGGDDSDSDDGGESGEIEPCASNADCPTGICWANEAPLTTECQPVHNGACFCGVILFD